MLAWIKKMLSSETATLSPYQESVLRFRSMVCPSESVYSDIRPLISVAPSMDIYFQCLNEAINALDNNRIFRSAMFPLTAQTVRRVSFYTSQDGMYLDLNKEHHLFTSAAIQLLELYERKTNEVNQSGLLQTNLLRILPLVNNLISLSTELGEDFSHS